MSDQTLQLVQVLRKRLQAATRRITLANFTFGLVLTCGVIATLWLVSAAAEASFWLGTTPRMLVLWTVLAVIGVLAAYFLLRPLLQLVGVLRGPSEEYVARRIGECYPDVSDRLVNLLQLVDGRRTEAPAPLVDGAVRMLGEEIDRVSFEQVEDFQRVRKVGRLASLPIVGLLLFLIAAPATFWGATQRLFSPTETFNRPVPFQLAVEPGSVELVKGTALDITVQALGDEQPQAVTLRLNHLNEEHVEEVRLTPDSTGTFRHTIVNVRTSMRYSVLAPPVMTRWYTATVTERPLVRNLQVSLDFPAYTDIPSQRLAPNVGDVTALPGTQVSLDVAFSGGSVEEAFIHFDDGQLDTLSLDGTQATGGFTLQREGSYQILLRNAQGIENRNPITYALQLQSDAFPSIALLEPAPQAELNDALRATLRARINDDFGFSRLRLFYRLAESRFGQPMETFEALPLSLRDPSQLDQEITYEWLIAQETSLDPVPGDVIEYYLQVWDNDTVAGYKTAKSATHRLRLPSITERYEQLDTEQDQTEETIEDLVRESEEVRQQFQELRDELRRKQQGDWEDQRQLERVQEKQKELESRVENLSRQMEEMTQEMQDNNLVSDETLEMFEELQQVVEEINSPELREALDQLRQAMQDLNLQQMQQAMENFQFNEEQYQQRLERTLELFKRLRVQQDLEEAARRAAELAQQQERLAEETDKLKNQEGDEAENPSDAEEAENPAEEQQGEPSEEQREGDPADDENAEQNEAEAQDPSEQQDNPSEQQNETGGQQEGQEPQEDQESGDQNSSERPSRNEQLAQEQERSSEEMEQLQELMTELQERMQEVKNSPRNQMQQLNQELEQQKLPEQMKQNAEQLRQQQFQQAQQQQQQMQQQLEQMQQQMQQMQQQMQGQQMQINLAGLRQALSDILTLSEQQERLRSDVSNSAADSPRLRDYAQRQTEMSEGLRVVSDSLQQLARRIPQMSRAVQERTGNALNEMNQATDALAERSAQRASGHQKGSMMHLNELALLLSDLLNQMQNASGGGSGSMSMQQMIEQLQQMGQQQQQLNQQIQQLLNDMQGNRLTQDMQERLRQMAAQQQSLRQQLKELSRNRELRNKVLGDLDKIAEQMEESIQELQRNQVNRRTQIRQRQILTRLLNATRSLREQGREKRREGQQAEDDLTRESPPGLTPEQQAEQLRRALIQALESGYAPDYEELIKRYFELLQQQEER